MSGHKVHADDTSIGVLSPGHGKTKTARLWTYVRGDRSAGYTTPAAVWFATRQIARENIPALIPRVSARSYRLTAMPVLLSCMRRALFRKPPAGLMPAASFTMSTKTRLHHLLARRCKELLPCMPSRAKFEGNRQTNAKRFGKAGPVRCWNNYTHGLTRRSLNC